MLTAAKVGGDMERAGSNLSDFHGSPSSVFSAQAQISAPIIKSPPAASFGKASIYIAMTPSEPDVPKTPVNLL